jgi:hypothetical protein
MKILRRAFMAVFMAGVLAGGLRLRGRGGTPAQHGGWRRLDLTADPLAPGTPERP